MSDSNIIYVEDGVTNYPFVFICGRMLRNALITIKPDDWNYKKFHQGRCYCMCIENFNLLQEDLRSMCMEFVVSYISFDNVREEGFLKNLESGKL